MSEQAGHVVQMRWRDIDGLAHVNHAVVLTFLEEGRDAFLESRGIARDEYVVGRCSVTFEKEITATSKFVSVECSVSQLGNSSLTTRERLLDGKGELAVEAEFGLVMWDAETRGPRPISDLERSALTRPVGGPETA